jgi:hypothetical protein
MKQMSNKSCVTVFQEWLKLGGLDPLAANLSYVTNILEFLTTGSRQLGFQVGKLQYMLVDRVQFTVVKTFLESSRSLLTFKKFSTVLAIVCSKQSYVISCRINVLKKQGGCFDCNLLTNCTLFVL